MKRPHTDEDEQPLERTAVAAGPARRHTRRLEDKMLVVFHHACDVKDLEIADQILRLLEVMLSRRPVASEGNRRRTMESFVAAHERLWHIRHNEVS